jgi:ribosome-associated translation inhibitor RaiA
LFVEIPIDFLIRAGQVETTEALRDYAARRLSFALRRFLGQIRHVTVRVVDVNGPKRGVDTRCAITADLTDGRRVFVEAIAAWPFGAITDAASRLRETIRRAHARGSTSSVRPTSGSNRLARRWTM